MNYSPHCALSTCYKGKYIAQTVNTKFDGVQIDNHPKLGKSY